MPMNLDEVEVRVLGALMEKSATTPEYYPLTLNALVAACNQKNNRDPVTAYGEAEVKAAVDRLRGRGLCLETTGSGHRVAKYSERLAERLNLGRRESALLCELMLRGPQTPGELRSRAQRMYDFPGLEEVEGVLRRLAQDATVPDAAPVATEATTAEGAASGATPPATGEAPPGPPAALVVLLERVPGERERRYAHLLSGAPAQAGPLPAAASAGASAGLSLTKSAAGPPAPAEAEIVRQLEFFRQELANLRRDFDDFRRRFE
jgi:uncharacterized protein YceH (UPF0502 family)